MHSYLLWINFYNPFIKMTWKMNFYCIRMKLESKRWIIFNKIMRYVKMSHILLWTQKKVTFYKTINLATHFIKFIGKKCKISDQLVAIVLPENLTHITVTCTKNMSHTSTFRCFIADFVVMISLSMCVSSCCMVQQLVYWIFLYLM